jgi:hypothetical protein
MAQITPGPWAVLKGAAEGDDMRCAVVVERGKMQYLLATVENGAPGDFCETEEANATAIAAIPDFMEAAAMMTAAEDSGGDLWWRGFNALKAAYKKAGGEFPSMDQIGSCREGDRCGCGGDTPAVRAGCHNWIK